MENVQKDSLLLFPCPGCNAQLYFNPEHQKLECKYCGTQVAIDQSSNQIREKSLKQQLSVAGDPDADKPTSFYGGAWVRLGDAFIPYIGLEFGDLRVGTTYDINTSSLKAASQSRGGIEISLIYIKHAGESKGLPCPKF